VLSPRQDKPIADALDFALHGQSLIQALFERESPINKKRPMEKHAKNARPSGTLYQSSIGQAIRMKLTRLV